MAHQQQNLQIGSSGNKYSHTMMINSNQQSRFQFRELPIQSNQQQKIQFISQAPPQKIDFRAVNSNLHQNNEQASNPSIYAHSE